jgi:hypothetical protein
MIGALQRIDFQVQIEWSGENVDKLIDDDAGLLLVLILVDVDDR